MKRDKREERRKEETELINTFTCIYNINNNYY